MDKATKKAYMRGLDITALQGEVKSLLKAQYAIVKLRKSAEAKLNKLKKVA